MSLKHSDLRQAVIESANSLIRAGAISMSHHGNFSVLAFGADPAAAARANLIVEEAAQMAIFAEVLGGAKKIPLELLTATVARRDEFARAGVQRT